MIPRYTNPDMGRIWSDQRKYETWLQVELAAVDAMARAGIVPTDAARDIRARATFSIDRIEDWKLSPVKYSPGALARGVQALQ